LAVTALTVTLLAVTAFAVTLLAVGCDSCEYRVHAHPYAQGMAYPSRRTAGVGKQGTSLNPIP